MTELKRPHQLEAESVREYKALLGKMIWVYAISGYIGDHSVDLKLKTPLQVRVEKTADDCIARWNDEWLDPVMEVSIVTPTDEVANLRSTWVYGTCRHPNGSIEQSDLVQHPVVLRADDRKKWRFIVELVAEGVTVTADGDCEAEDMVKEDAREFAGSWNYTLGKVRKANINDKAGITPDYKDMDVTRHIGDLDFEQVKSGGNIPHYEFTITCKPIVLAEDEADAIVQIVDLMGTPASTVDEDATSDTESRTFRQRPKRAGRIPVVVKHEPTNQEARSRRSEAGDATTFAEGMSGMRIVYASDATKRTFLEATGRQLGGSVEEETPAADACWITISSGKRLLAEGPFDADIGMIRVWTPLEKEGYMLVRPTDIVAIEFSE